MTAAHFSVPTFVVDHIILMSKNSIFMLNRLIFVLTAQPHGRTSVLPLIFNVFFVFLINLTHLLKRSEVKDSHDRQANIVNILFMLDSLPRALSLNHT